MVTTGDQVAAVFQGIASLRGALRDRDALTLRDQIAITRIASPSGEEDERAQFISARFRAVGLTDVRIDDAGNVIARRPGLRELPPVIVCAHMDTVFSRETELSVRASENRLCAPGIGDNSRGLAAMLALAESFAAERITTDGPIDFLASTGEEGMGDLRGSKFFFSEHQDALALIALDGPGDDKIVTSALGCIRMRLHFTGHGGHSWSAYGIPNAIHAVGIATAAIARIQVPATPRCTVSVTRIGGGIAVNAIPDRAWIDVDIRSISEHAIERLAAEVKLAGHAAAVNVNDTRLEGTQELSLQFETLGRRPCGHLPDEHPLACAAVRATELIQRKPELAMASTDANVPLSLGIPAIAIGAGGRGGAAHTVEEWFENEGGSLGIVRAATIVLAAAGLPGV